MPVDGEPLLQRRGDGRADPVDGGQLLLGRRLDRLDRAEVAGQRLRGGRADVADGQRHQNPPQRPGLRLVQVGQQLDRVGAERAVLVDEELAAP